MKPSRFSSIVERYSQTAEEVYLTGGEPLLHPEIDELVKIVKDSELPVYTSTNGILVQKREDVMKSFDGINVSVDGYDHESFHRFRGGTPDDFDSILGGFRILRDNSVKFGISFLLSMGNIDDIFRMLDFSREIEPDGVTFHNINPHGSRTYAPITVQDAQFTTKVMPILREVTNKTDYPFNIRLPHIFNEAEHSSWSTKCVMPWLQCCFDPTGNIAPCCHLRHDRRFGNIFNGYDFNSEGMRKFRRRVLKNDSIAEDCLYCQTRFQGGWAKEHAYGLFDARSAKWAAHPTEAAKKCGAGGPLCPNVEPYGRAATGQMRNPFRGGQR